MLRALHDQHVASDLANEPEHLGMPFLAENDHLAAAFEPSVGRAYVLLEPEHHRTGAVDYAVAQGGGRTVDRGRLAVGPDQQGLPFGTLEPRQRRDVHGHESQGLEPREFLLVVDYRPERIQPAPVIGELVLGGLDRPYHPSAETGVGVDLDLHHSIPNFPWIRPVIHASSSSMVISELSSPKASSARRSGEASRWESM